MPPQKKDIVIVGGGIIGSTTAYFLTRHPKFNPTHHSITLLEAPSVASGASGKAGGLLALWAYPSCLASLSFNLHAELAKEHGGAERWGYRRVGVGQVNCRARRTSGQPKSSANGQAKGGDVKGEVDENVSLQKRSKESYSNLRKVGCPADLDWFAAECVMSYESMGGPDDTAQVHPYQFTTSMASLAEEAGAKIVLGIVQQIICTNDGVESVKYTDKSTGEEKSIPATDVVISAGPWTKTVWPGSPISALRAHSVTIRPTRPVSAYALFTGIKLPPNFRDGVNSRAKLVTPEIYARPNNEIYACGEGDHLVPLPATAADVQCDDSRCQDVVDYISSISDELRDGEMLVRQACYLPQNDMGGSPLVGLTGTKGVFMAAGHTCWGIQNGPGTGKLMSEFIMDGKAGSANVASLDPRMVL